MKLIDTEEKAAHIEYFTAEGAKGIVYGSVLSFAIFEYLRSFKKAKFNSFNTSIKACILIMPTISIGAFWADQGSVEFDRRLYSTRSSNVMEEYRSWKNMKFHDKALHSLKEYEYQYLTGAWLASLYGLRKCINRETSLSPLKKVSRVNKFSGASTLLFILLGTFIYNYDHKSSK